MQKKMRLAVVILLCVMIVFSVAFRCILREVRLQVAENTEVAEVVPLVRFEQIIVYQHNMPRLPNYSLQQLYDLDLRIPSGVTEEDLKKVTRKGLVGLERAFYEAEKKYGINCLFLVSVAALESGWGTVMFQPNNMFGFGNKSFASKEQCIDYVARQISANYLARGKYTPRTINTSYAANTTWYSRISEFMYNMYQTIRATKDTTPPLPAELFTVSNKNAPTSFFALHQSRKTIFFNKNLIKYSFNNG